MIFVDSSVWIDWFRNSPTAQTSDLDRLLPSTPVIIGDLVLAEVLQGIADPGQFERTRTFLLRRIVVSVAGPEIALLAATNYRYLRTCGFTPRKTLDTLIATRCIAESWPLLASDRDFQPFAEHLGLKLVS